MKLCTRLCRASGFLKSSFHGAGLSHRFVTGLYHAFTMTSSCPLPSLGPKAMYP